MDFGYDIETRTCPHCGRTYTCSPETFEDPSDEDCPYCKMAPDFGWAGG